MKVRLRRPAPSSSSPEPTEPTAAPGPPRGAPVARFAGILDGQSLWVAIDAAPGSLALRETESGDVIASANDAPDDQPAYSSIRVDLGTLAGDKEHAEYDVVLVPPGGRAPRPVWAADLPATRISPTHDARTQWALTRTDEGILHLSRTALDETAWLTVISEEADGVRVTVIHDGADRSNDESALHFALLNEGEPVVTFPAIREGRTVSGVLVADAKLDPNLDVQTRLALGPLDGNSWVPVRRQRDDLPDPGRGAPLPAVHLPGTETVRFRLRFGGEAYLVARILPVDPPGGDS